MDKGMKYLARALSALLFWGAVAAGAAAEEVATPADGSPLPEAWTPAFEKELWLTTGFLSHHTGHAHKYNQHNDGLGAEWRVAPQWQFNAGHYRNSVRHGSTYLQAGWMPLDEQPAEGWRVRGGASVGLIDGYPKVRHGGYFPTLVPALSLETSRIGLNTLYIPSVGKRVDGAFAIQLKLRVG
jgi:hypothetical protein